MAQPNPQKKYASPASGKNESDSAESIGMPVLPVRKTLPTGNGMADSNKKANAPIQPVQPVGTKTQRVDHTVANANVNANVNASPPKVSPATQGAQSVNPHTGYPDIFNGINLSDNGVDAALAGRAVQMYDIMSKDKATMPAQTVRASGLGAKYFLQNQVPVDKMGHYAPLGLSRGQWKSVLFLGAALIFGPTLINSFTGGATGVVSSVMFSVSALGFFFVCFGFFSLMMLAPEDPILRILIKDLQISPSIARLMITKLCGRAPPAEEPIPFLARVLSEKRGYFLHMAIQAAFAIFAFFSLLGAFVVLLP